MTSRTDQPWNGPIRELEPKEPIEDLKQRVSELEEALAKAEKDVPCKRCGYVRGT